MGARLAAPKISGAIYLIKRRNLTTPLRAASNIIIGDI